MSNKIIVGEYQVELLKRRVYLNNTEISIRPKSFELLNLLLLTPNEVVSKEKILATIWNDVTVDEQVIFQSIKELRKAFSEIDAIKTFPRKGYAWVADITSVSETIIDEQKHDSVTKATENNGSAFIKKENKLSILGFTVLLVSLVFMLNFWFSNHNESVGEKIDGSIIVMPIKEHLNDRDHKWVRIGGMDLLIQQIPPSKNYGVMQVDDVLAIMKRAHITTANFEPTQVDAIFKVSGAELIIETELSGSPGDYQLVYTLRRRQSIDRGVLIAAEIYDAIDQLALVVTEQLGTSASSLRISRNKLANQLLAQSFDAKNADEYLEAEQYLKSTLAIEPNNLQAKRMLVEISTYLKKTPQINEIVLSVKRNRQTSLDNDQREFREREYGRLLFWQGLNELQFQRIENAKAIFEEATGIISSAQDWLYLGYLAEGQGHLYRSMKKYDIAKVHYTAAIKNHRIIKCPFGEGNNLLNLAENTFLQSDYLNATKQASQALSLANKRELNDLIEKAKLAHDKYNAVPTNKRDELLK